MGAVDVGAERATVDGSDGAVAAESGGSVGPGRVGEAAATSKVYDGAGEGRFG